MTTTHQPTLVRRAAHTPARDWLRGRITGRLDWRGVIAAADLPHPLADLVTLVVRRSRLWRLEKADLAAELCTHFADGQAAGATPEDLAMHFGNPRHAARLMRRAKRRNRHWTALAFTHTFQGLGALLLAAAVAYAVLAWRYYSGEPTIARNYAAEYNETIEAIPEQDRAWDLYIETYVAMEHPPEALTKVWPAPSPAHPLYAEALAYLESQSDVIEITHRAASKPRLGSPMSDVLDPRMVEANRARDPSEESPLLPPAENPLLVSILLPELGHQRALARLLTFDAHVAAPAGESDRALRDITSMLGMANHACERPFLISNLVGIAIQHLAINTTAEIIHDYPDLFTDDQLRELAHRHAAFMQGQPLVNFTGERWFFEDVVQRVYTDDGNGHGHITAEGVRDLLQLTGSSSNSFEDFGPAPLAPLTAALIADRADMSAMYEELMDRMERDAHLPMWEYESRSDARAEIERIAADPIQRKRYLPIVLLMPALEKAAQVAEQSRQRRDALLTGIALERFKRDHATYPDSLDALVPDYLPAVPPDRFTGKPLNYALIDAQPTLWSVGADRDNDHGRAPEGRDYSSQWLSVQQVQSHLDSKMDALGYDGDWVLWPIVYEPIKQDDPD